MVHIFFNKETRQNEKQKQSSSITWSVFIPIMENDQPHHTKTPKSLSFIKMERSNVLKDIRSQTFLSPTGSVNNLNPLYLTV